MKNFKLRGHTLIDYLNNGLTLSENLALIDEQLRIERVALLTEIATLRKALDAFSSAGEIKTWEQHTDEIYERLYTYQLGRASVVIKRHHIFLPYSHRRTVRTLFSS